MSENVVEKKKTIYSELSQINFDELGQRTKAREVKRRNDDGTYSVEELTYVSWATALDVLMEHYPDAIHRDIEFDDNGFEIEPNTKVKVTKSLEDGTVIEMTKVLRGHPYRMIAGGFVVETEVTVDGVTKRCSLPVMNYNNTAAKQLDPNVVNKSLKRCLVKNIAEFGLGLYLYAGEYFMEEDEADNSGNKNLSETVGKTERKLKTSKKSVEKKSASSVDKETDPMKMTIKTPLDGLTKVVGKPMSDLITKAKSIDSAMKTLNWYEAYGKNGDAELAKKLKSMLNEGKISFPENIVAGA